MALFILPVIRAEDANGNPLSGAKLYFYATGGLTPAAVYTTSGLSVAHATPVVADSGGMFAPIYLDPSITYRCILKTSGGTTVQDIDPYSASDSSSSSGTNLFNEMSVISSSADRIQTAGYSAIGEGAAAYIYDAAVDAAYVTANPRTSFRTSNSRGYRLDPQQPLTIQMFGGKADGTASLSAGPYLGTLGATDNAPALNAALALIAANKVSVGSNNYYRGGARIHFPAADGVYDFQSTVDVRCSCTITGDTSGNTATWGTALRWRPGMHGIVIHSYASDLSGVLSPAAWGGPGTILDGLAVVQHGTSNTYTGTYHGIYLRVPTIVTNCFSGHWNGSGFYGLGGVPDSNINRSLLINCVSYANEHGIHVDGGDANIITGISCDCSVNRGYGIFDSSFLGNNWIGCHTDSNGCAHASSHTTVSSMVSYSGNWYYVKVGQTVGGSTNAPSGTTADNTWWGYISAGGVDAGHPAWVSGITIREGGAYRTDSTGNARSTFVGCYAEGTNGANYFVQPTMVFSGIFGNPTEAVNVSIFTNLSGVTDLSNDFRSRGSVTSNSATSGIGYSTGAGGTVTQLTNKSTGVTLNKICGQITLNNAALADATNVKFTVTNSAAAATDTVTVNHSSGGTAGAYQVWCSKVAAGSFDVSVRNVSGGSLSEAAVLNFIITKAVAA
jgi:hypothetical protein